VRFQTGPRAEMHGALLRQAGTSRSCATILDATSSLEGIVCLAEIVDDFSLDIFACDNRQAVLQ